MKKYPTEEGAGDKTSAPTKSGKKGKYMHTIDHGNDHRRPEDGPVGTKAKFQAWPGMGSK